MYSLHHEALPPGCPSLCRSYVQPHPVTNQLQPQPHLHSMYALHAAGAASRLPYFVLIPDGEGRLRAEHVTEWFTFRPEIK